MLVTDQLMAAKCSWAKKEAFFILTQTAINNMSINLLLNVLNKSEKNVMSELVIFVVQSDS